MKKVRLRDIFLVFAKIGTFTIGGGYMMIPAIQDELSRRQWIPDDELPDIVALAQSAPGLLTANMAIFAGYRLRGVKGSIAATLGSMLSPVLIILAIAMFLGSYAENPLVMRIFAGVRPAAVAVMVAFTVKLARGNGAAWWKWLLSLATLALIALLKVSPIWIILVVIAGAVGIGMWRERQ